MSEGLQTPIFLKNSNFIETNIGVKRSFSPRKFCPAQASLSWMAKFAELRKIWMEAASRNLLTLVIRFFCKKKSRSETERQYDAGQSRYIYIIRNMNQIL